MAELVVFGANGNIGSRVVTEALRRGHIVTAVARDPNKITQTHERLGVMTGDVLDPAVVTAASRGRDVVISAVGGGDGPGHLETIEPSARALVAGLRELGGEVPRLVTVGGAGSLRTPDGTQVWDAEGLPENLVQIMRAHGDALDFYRTVTDLDWTNLSPAQLIQPGERTGTYRSAGDELVTDSEGNSSISMEDYAVALLDEVEDPRHTRQRFTVAY